VSLYAGKYSKTVPNEGCITPKVQIASYTLSKNIFRKTFLAGKNFENP
jgi:hypothetical protein